MANESNNEAEQNKEGDIDLDLEIDTENEEEKESKSEEKKDDKKSEETPEARLARLERMTAQQKKKMGIDSSSKSEKKSESKKSDDLDYGQKAYLRAEGIKRGDEESLVMEYIKNTGKSLEDILDNKHFQNDLKDLRETIATSDAIPKGSKRSAQSSIDSVEYWIAKGELPPADQMELRRKVVNAKIKAETQTNVFSPRPVVGN